MPNQKDTIIARLQQHAGEWFTDIPKLKGFLLCAHYFSLPNHSGGVARPAESFVTRAGKVITFKDVPTYKLVESIERQIETSVPNDRRTGIYHKVLKGMPGYKAVPAWDIVSKESIYAEPLTPFSMPRDDTISNQDLLDLLAPAAEITLSNAHGIGIQICWWDAMSGGKVSASMSFGDGVSGGRLGRNHKHSLSDVPRNYFRDRLMDYINVQLDSPEEVKQAAREAICPDLTVGEIEEYSRLITEDRKQKDEKTGTGASSDRSLPTREEIAREIMETRREVSTMAQAMKILLLNEAIEKIDDTIDWQTPKPMGLRRRRGTEVTGSVVLPHFGRMRCEWDVHPDDEIDHDCDQVRAMIKKFVTGWGNWELDQFRSALADNMSRDRFLTFLNKRGTDVAQKNSAAYLLSWEFFNRRQKLGLSIEDADTHIDMGILRERQEDAERTDRERALVKVHNEERKPLDDRHDNETAALRKKHEEQSESTKKTHLEQLKALAEDYPWGTPGRSEKLRELEEKQGKESDAQSEEHRKEQSALSDAHYKEMMVLEEEHEKQLEALKEDERLEALREKEQVPALGEARPGRLNTGKRASGGASGGGGKKARTRA